MKGMDMVEIGESKIEAIPGTKSIFLVSDNVNAAVKQALMRVYYEDDPSWADCLHELGIIKRDAML